MISLFKLHFYYLFSWKTLYISLGLIGISIISFLLFSHFYLALDLLVFNARYYQEEYYFESINFLKINIIIYNLFLIINSFFLNKYDNFLIIRKPKKTVIITKILTLLLGSNALMLIFYLLFLIIGLYLTPYMHVSIKDLAILGDLLIFSSVYLLGYIVVALYAKTIYSLLPVIVGFMISDLSTDYYLSKKSVSLSTKLINLLFISISNYSETGYSFYYGKVYGIILFSGLFIVVYVKYIRSDF